MSASFTLDYHSLIVLDFDPVNEVDAILDRIASGNITETCQRSRTSAFTANVPNRENYQRSQVARDSKLIVAFDELKCYILNQDLKARKLLGTGRQFGGLYYFDENQVFEDIFPFKQKIDMLDESSVPILNNLNFFDFNYLNDHSDIPNDEERSEPILNRYGTPSPHPGSTFEPLNESEKGHSQGLNVVANNYCFASVLNKSFKPKSFEEAVKHQPWVDAIMLMNSEMDALFIENNTWDLVNLSKGRKAIGSKWV
ncbi:hypothetical protein Tco_0865150 [Tanacetum coccineum]